jgi:hypothetical protein
LVTVSGSARLRAARPGLSTAAFPAIWDKFLFDDTQGLHWDQMAANSNRQASAVNNLNLVWDGPTTVLAAPSILGRLPQLVINSPAGIAGTYQAVPAQFGPQVNPTGVTGKHRARSGRSRRQQRPTPASRSRMPARSRASSR